MEQFLPPPPEETPSHLQNPRMCPKVATELDISISVFSLNLCPPQEQIIANTHNSSDLCRALLSGLSPFNMGPGCPQAAGLGQTHRREVMECKD